MATSKIQHTEATVTTLDAGASGITAYSRLVYDPNTRTVRIFLSARSSSDIGLADALAVVPAAYRPSADVDFPGYISRGTAAAAYRCIVKTDGRILQGYTGYAREAITCGEYQI